MMMEDQNGRCLEGRTGDQREAGGKERLRSEKIPVETAKHILRVLAGDWATEEKIVRFLKERYGAATVLNIPLKVAAEIIRRPGDLIRAAKAWREPELFFGDVPGDGS